MSDRKSPPNYSLSIRLGKHDLPLYTDACLLTPFDQHIVATSLDDAEVWSWVINAAHEERCREGDRVEIAVCEIDDDWVRPQPQPYPASSIALFVLHGLNIAQSTTLPCPSTLTDDPFRIQPINLAINLLTPAHPASNLNNSLRAERSPHSHPDSDPSPQCRPPPNSTPSSTPPTDHPQFLSSCNPSPCSAASSSLPGTVPTMAHTICT